MEGDRVYGASDLIAFFENSTHSLWLPSTSHSSFHENMVNFNQEAPQGRRLSPNPSDKEDGGEELEINPFYHHEKKRRLTPQQVQFLEKNFEVENKLEPERKVQLAKELGLQPRQVAIWFQNRRARFKTKQLEKDYGSLKANYDRLKDNFETLIKERDDLQIEVKSLMKKLKQRGMGQENWNPDNPEYPLQLDPTREEVTKTEFVGEMHVEDANSAKSDVFDSESPHWTEGNYHSSPIEKTVDSPIPKTQI